MTDPDRPEPPGDASAGREANTLQTLDRGLQALAVIAQQEDGLSVAELANRLGVHRAITYRLVRTLESHGLVGRGAGGQFFLGAGLLGLAARFEPQLRSIARPMLRALAEETQAAAFLTVPQGEECVAVMVAEPERGVLHLGYRVGSRHRLIRGAAGIAILAGRPPRPDDPESVREARRLGFSVTRGELQRGAVGVASPVFGAPGRLRGFEASLGVVALDDLDIPRATAAVLARARELAATINA
jgi:DNA-binding IclR family transcriptional regulator